MTTVYLVVEDDVDTTDTLAVFADEAPAQRWADAYNEALRSGYGAGVRAVELTDPDAELPRRVETWSANTTQPKPWLVPTVVYPGGPRTPRPTVGGWRGFTIASGYPTAEAARKAVADYVPPARSY